VPLDSAEVSPGVTGQADAIVTGDMTAEAMGSGDDAVLATPAVVALIERAAVRALEGRLPEGRTSVGASVTLDHVAPTTAGASVTATARLDMVEEGRPLEFAVEVTDPAGVVARGTHWRVVVDRSRFLERAAARAKW